MATLSGESTDASVPGVKGENTDPSGDGVWGIGRRGVLGVGKTSHGVDGLSHDPNSAGVFGGNDGKGFGVIGISDSNIGVAGDSTTGTGVRGTSEAFRGVFGTSRDNSGVVGESAHFHAIFGISHDLHNAGVIGINDKAGFGVIGVSEQGIGINGKGGTLAGRFEGDVMITSTLNVVKDVVLVGGDCAEHFDATPDAICEPGTVMTIGMGGALDASSKAYDKKVAGVVSGAGNFRPAIILDRQLSNTGRPPVALTGKVYCKVDAEYAAIEIGDLLTTSDTLGHAMKASDTARAFGAVVGKALGPLSKGRGIIPILVSLQ